ncbi:MAG: hypothetical protein HY748_00315 [Elusimicrobia bacterium]|nr:hypothetical protein [Elusimicrobiota bacterium]
MTRLALPVLLLGLAAAPPASAMQDTRLAWGRNDTNWHMGVSFGVSLLGTELLELGGWKPWKAAAASSLAVATAAVVKEFLIDRSPSGSDLMADGIGLGAHGLLQFTIHFDWPTSKAPDDKTDQ